ncbi:adenine phosphoribosyltransferase [Tessaracoccus sp. OH4464_COT-324]|uniref:adenine phosphoribosyltransferase n=1 Tax=Tessaracoccus sp. OH4464_COT-324 TaxID=2491059 RepID=UPI000F62FC30|nr:adenine phosphoribosyltransferase [Tessaracoccus sp. OH4464_COT-324]RRD47939.1 adenine phosphoribosyltransferase [Tessaracoccus sp. OH4464_COT-324]
MNEDLGGLIRDVVDFPKPGVVFKDITPLLGSPKHFQLAVDQLTAAAPEGVDAVVGMEARGFILAAPVALQLGAAFVPVRKPGKLPGDVYSQSFDLEYGSETLTVHRNAIRAGARVLVIDDVLATGGTVVATAGLLKQLGAELVHVGVLLELGFLGGRKNLAANGITRLTSLVYC